MSLQFSAWCGSAHDEFSSSFICFPQFIGSVKFFAIKHPSKVSTAFACNNNSIAIHLITRWHSLRSTSLSDVCAALQAGPSLKISTGYFLYALSSYGYGFIPFAYSKHLGENVGLPRSTKMTNNVRLGLSCPPAVQQLRISCVKRLYLVSSPFWHRAYHSHFSLLPY
jgi:hypothetical protein